MIERSDLNYAGYPCDGCKDMLTCEDPGKLYKTVVNMKVERGCVEFAKWTRSPIQRARRD